MQRMPSNDCRMRRRRCRRGWHLLRRLSVSVQLRMMPSVRQWLDRSRIWRGKQRISVATDTFSTLDLIVCNGSNRLTNTYLNVPLL